MEAKAVAQGILVTKRARKGARVRRCCRLRSSKALIDADSAHPSTFPDAGLE
jgi:hypothetical protein